MSDAFGSEAFVHGPVVHPHAEAQLQLDADTLETLWLLFAHIGRFWQTVDDPEPMRTRWLVFLQNRMRTDCAYVDDYRQAAEVLRALVNARGEDAAFEYLFTNRGAAISPPSTRLARVRQRVSNEFIDFQLEAGGFRAFGARNYPGYFGGANIPDLPPPYRPAPDGDGGRR